jgi:hypothetical protein
LYWTISDSLNLLLLSENFKNQPVIHLPSMKLKFLATDELGVTRTIFMLFSTGSGSQWLASVSSLITKKWK